MDDRNGERAAEGADSSRDKAGTGVGSGTGAGSAVVVGGGVIGLTTAVILAERGMDVRVWSRESPGETTSSVAGGLCWPYRIKPEERALDWAVRSFRQFSWLAEQPPLTGVRLVRGRMPDGAPPEVWTSLTGTPPRAPIVDMRTYLPYLLGRFEAAGGRYERRAASSLAEAAAEAPVVVNASGLGARELVPDPAVRAVRGQVVVVENPGIEEWYVVATGGASETTYILPQPYGLILGGTAHEDAEVTEPDPATAEAIVRRCARIHPALADTTVLEHRVGLRPFRPSVRLETERVPDGRGGTSLCVHNYGHGGAGVTVSWGCAVDAARLVAPAAVDGAPGRG
ncbi:FAD-dependent oxidoreductase [Streptomyces iconiensis]|uniref:D-amino-acid oxidase n=1 Tax=Streptomyces iconiensis TaxID=1384038 RepID=A0ABT6ZPU5_9ACTN|nr:FAD-dependent oxidoreductase [Streptomyces iconiensis]MDJ1131073.1 FAD-dependent oxidoreductase [Streptomyces iconiensis]